MIDLLKTIESRKKTAELIKKCLYDGYLVREALKEWPDYKHDPTLMCAWHALVHFEVDIEVFQGNSEYRDEQIEWLEHLITILSEGRAIPKNIIDNYEEYYVMPETLLYRLKRTTAKATFPFLMLYTKFLSLFVPKQNH